MGAIFGTIAFNEESNTVFEKMEPALVKKCRLDLFSSKSLGHAQMGAGVLVVREKDKKETLPIISQDGRVLLTADCLLDNSEELKATLVKEYNSEFAEGIGPINELTDGQLLLALYLKFGTASFAMLRGLFSVAIWHEDIKKLILVSDPVSSRCLYYYRKGSSFYFSTLVEPIRQAVGGIELNKDYIEDFLMAPGMMPNLFSVYTPFKDVMKCNAGEWLEITERDTIVHSYIDFSEAISEKIKGSSKKIGSEFRKTFEACIGDAITSDYGIAVSMSSGLDSASIATLAAKQLESKGKELKAYTYVPSEDIEKSSHKNFVLDETKDVLEICKPYKNISNSFLNNQGRNCLEQMDEVVDTLEMPIKAFVNFPNLFEIMQEASNVGCKVVLTGQSGNASISHGYIDDVLFDLYEKKSYVRMLSYLNSYCKFLKESRRGALTGCFRYFNHSRMVLNEGIEEYPNANEFLKKDFVDTYPFRDRFFKAGVLSLENIPMDERMYKEFLFNRSVYAYLGEYETKLGLKYGVVIRDACKDIRMIKFCNSIPYNYFAYKGVPRWLIRNNLKDLLPESLLNDWMRYGVQNSDWLRRVKRDWESHSINSKLLDIIDDYQMNEYVDKDKVSDSLNNIWSMDEGKIDLELSQLGYIYSFYKLKNSF